MNKIGSREWIQEHLEIGKELIYLTRKQCQDLNISRGDMFDLTEKALMLYGTNQVEMPPKIGVHPFPGACFHAMPANLIEERAVGVKWNAGYNDNPQIWGLPSYSGLIIYNDYETGCPIAVMDCIYIMHKRTPAVSFASAKYMANLDAETFGMIGCGIQGMNHIEIACDTLKNLKKIYVYDAYESAMEKLVALYQDKVPAEIVMAKSYEELAKSSEVISTATILTKEPVVMIKDEWIGKGQTILVNDMHPMFDPKTMARADKYVVDSMPQHKLMEEYGYYPGGLPEMYGEIGNVIAGNLKGRENKDEFIVCNNIGIAAVDIQAAKVLFERALEKGIGTKLEI